MTIDDMKAAVAVIAKMAVVSVVAVMAVMVVLAMLAMILMVSMVAMVRPRLEKAIISVFDRDSQSLLALWHKKDDDANLVPMHQISRSP